MNVHQSRPQGLDNTNYSHYHQQQSQQQQAHSWSSMPSHAGFGRAVNPYDRPLQNSQSYHHQTQPSLAYAPPHAPHLSNRNYQPMTNPYYPAVYSTPYPVAPAQFYPQQSRHAFANSTGYSAQRPTAFSIPPPPPPPPYRGNEQQQLGFSQGYSNGNFSTPQQQQLQQDRSYSQERMRSQSRGRWNGQQSTNQPQQQQQLQQRSERSNSNESIWRDGSSRESSTRMSGAALSRMSSSTSSSEFTPALGQDIWNQNTYTRQESSVDLDHPSFDRPPHRSSVSNIQVEVAPVIQTPQIIESASTSKSSNENVEYDLIPNLSPVPPPPAIEFSAVPLSDLATEMVWEACVLAVQADHSSNRWARLTNKPPSLFNEVADSNRRLRLDSEDSQQHPIGTSLSSTRSSSPFNNVPELYGAIGEGRNRSRKLSDTTCGSVESSPSSSTPGTPAGVGAMEAAAARRMMGFGFGFPSQDGKSVDYDSRSSSIDSTMEGIRANYSGGGRRFQQSISPLHPSNSNKFSSPTSPSPPTSPSFPAEPSTAFRQFVKSILTATLVAPEDLVLALYYVASIPSTSMIPPMVNESRANAIKAAPFKILLGALMLANKTLQDNSYRNETFAAVSGIPLKDVNDLEVFVFGALGFDVAVRGDIWKTWISVVRERVLSKRGGGELGNRYEVNVALDKLWKAATKESFGPVRYEENQGVQPSFDVLVDVATIASPKEEGEIDEDEDIEMGLGEFEGPLKPKTPLRTGQSSSSSSRRGSEKVQLEPLRFNGAECRGSAGGAVSEWEVPRRQSHCAR